MLLNDEEDAFWGLSQLMVMNKSAMHSKLQTSLISGNVGARAVDLAAWAWVRPVPLVISRNGNSR